MGNQFTKQNFYVASVQSPEIELMRKIPIFIKDLIYNESSSGLYGILYNCCENYSDCLDSYLNDKIELRKHELENIESIHDELLRDIPETEHPVVNKIFSLERAKFIDELVQMEKSLSKHEKFGLLREIENLL